jgi:arsenate reductase (glutaredoxin)
VEIWHNPACSKSRATLALLKENGVEPAVRLYLSDAPTESELREVITKLGTGARALLRTGEDEYRVLGLSDASLSEEALIAAMAKYPRLIERPVVISGDRAALGRPPEAVLALLPSR